MQGIPFRRPLYVQRVAEGVVLREMRLEQAARQRQPGQHRFFRGAQVLFRAPERDGAAAALHRVIKELVRHVGTLDHADHGFHIDR